jgi:hypothetical protein
MRRLHIQPILDLCHFGVPDWLGNFQNEDFAPYFAEYAGTSPAAALTSNTGPPSTRSLSPRCFPPSTAGGTGGWPTTGPTCGPRSTCAGLTCWP